MPLLRKQGTTIGTPAQYAVSSGKNIDEKIIFSPAKIVLTDEEGP